MQPVNAEHELALTENLANEALGGADWHPAVPMGGLRPRADLAGVEQPDIESGRKHAMKNERIILRHGVLIIAEPW
jgi:hypothetical protein